MWLWFIYIFHLKVLIVHKSKTDLSRLSRHHRCCLLWSHPSSEHLRWHLMFLCLLQLRGVKSEMNQLIKRLFSLIVEVPVISTSERAWEINRLAASTLSRDCDWTISHCRHRPSIRSNVKWSVQYKDYLSLSSQTLSVFQCTTSLFLTLS